MSQINISEPRPATQRWKYFRIGRSLCGLSHLWVMIPENSTKNSEIERFEAREFCVMTPGFRGWRRTRLRQKRTKGNGSHILQIHLYCTTATEYFIEMSASEPSSLLFHPLSGVDVGQNRSFLAQLSQRFLADCEWALRGRGDFPVASFPSKKAFICIRTLRFCPNIFTTIFRHMSKSCCYSTGDSCVFSKGVHTRVCLLYI